MIFCPPAKNVVWDCIKIYMRCEFMINKLIANIKKTNAPIVVGLDPMLKFVPE